MLEGGAECCVTITDDTGCSIEVCFTVEYTTDIVPTVTDGEVACNGDTDGVIIFSAVNGIPPYNYQWQNLTGTLSGSGTLSAEGEEASLTDLPAGEYEITINDAFLDTTFAAFVIEPEELMISLVDIQDAVALVLRWSGGDCSYGWHLTV